MNSSSQIKQMTNFILQEVSAPVVGLKWRRAGSGEQEWDCRYLKLVFLSEVMDSG